MKTLNPCIICKHPEYRHEDRNLTGREEWLSGICWHCDEGTIKKYHAFKLDNLKLIEQLAEAKGLI